MMEIVETPLNKPLESPGDLPSLHLLFEYLEHHAPETLPWWRWLVFGPGLASLASFEGLMREPTYEELGALWHQMDLAPPPVEAAGRWLIDERQDAVAALDRSLAKLVAADPASWRWPTQILRRPCPQFRWLLDSCVDRLKSASGASRRRLQGVREKLERAVRIEESARRRRKRNGSA